MKRTSLNSTHGAQTECFNTPLVKHDLVKSDHHIEDLLFLTCSYRKFDKRYAPLEGRKYGSIAATGCFGSEGI